MAQGTPMSDAVGVLTDLVKNCLDQIRQLGDRIDNKATDLEDRMTQHMLSMKTDFNRRLDKIEEQTKTTSDKVATHQLIVSSVKWAVGGSGLLGVIAIGSYIVGIFHH